MYDKDLDIIIVGGSLAGLWTGVVFKTLPNVSSITILERYSADQLHDLGAGIRTNEESIDAIRHFTGTGPEKYGVLVNAYKFINQEGQAYHSVSTNTYTTTWGQLYRVFDESYAADAKCTHRLGCKVVDLAVKDDQSVAVDFTNEHGQHETLHAHIVIGADGASSTIRHLMEPESTRTSAGYCCYRGIVPMRELSESSQALWRKSALFLRYEDSDVVTYLVPGNGGPADEVPPVVNFVWYLNKTPSELQNVLVDKQGTQHRFALPAGGMSNPAINELRATAEVKLAPPIAELVGKCREPFVQLVTDSSSSSNAFLGGKVLLVGDAVGGQRPHTASAFLQATFHGILVRQLLDDKISLDEWSAETLHISKILVEGGKELGKILMGKDLTPAEKGPLYLQSFMAVQNELNMKWHKFVGIGEANSKI